MGILKAEEIRKVPFVPCNFKSRLACIDSAERLLFETLLFAIQRI